MADTSPDSAAPAAPPVEAMEVGARVDRLADRVGALEQLILRRAREDQAQQVAFNALHAELQQYKADAQRMSQKPILKGLILMYDAACRLLETLPASRGTEAVETLAEEIIELLRRHDVEMMPEQPERFDNRIQMAIKTELVDRREDDQRVAQILRQGFRWGTQVLRPQEVIVKVYKGA